MVVEDGIARKHGCGCLDVMEVDYIRQATSLYE